MAEISRHSIGRLRNTILSIVAAGIASFLFFFSPVASAEEQVEVRIKAVPPLPEIVQSRLSDILNATLTDILFDGESSKDLRSSDPAEVASGIQTGINILIEPKGYTVESLHLDLASTPLIADFILHPTGWTVDNPHAVKDVKVSLSDKGLGPFWTQRFRKRLGDNSAAILDSYRRFLVGLPDHALDPEWALNLVLPDMKKSDPATGVFSDFKIEYSVTLGPVAEVDLSLEPSGNLVELIRPRMYSRTVCNLIMDRFRERLLASADFIEGMPKAEVSAASDEIAAAVAAKLDEDSLARRFGAHATCKAVVLPEEPVVMITAAIESRLYDLGLEGFVDFGNESRDSPEIEGRVGVLMGEHFEFFVNLNYFTNDSTLETDLAIGLIPVDGTFVAVGYDLSRKDLKYFFQHTLGNSFRLRGEVFKNDDLNEFGLTYQFQQYLSAGVFSNGNNEFWVRGIVRL